jgi:hypothetical protein
MEPLMLLGLLVIDQSHIVSTSFGIAIVHGDIEGNPLPSDRLEAITVSDVNKHVTLPTGVIIALDEPVSLFGPNFDPARSHINAPSHYRS